MYEMCSLRYTLQGMDVHLVGEANDYVGKSMSGGVISIVPPPGSSFQVGGWRTQSRARAYTQVPYSSEEQRGCKVLVRASIPKHTLAPHARYHPCMLPYLTLNPNPMTWGLGNTSDLVWYLVLTKLPSFSASAML